MNLYCLMLPCALHRAMYTFILESILAISLTINMFVAMYSVTAWALASSKFIDRWPLTIVRLNDDRPWYLPRYFVLTIGNIILFLMGITTLSTTHVVQSPFRDFPRSIEIGFSIMIGFYVFKLSLDSMHYAHFTGYGIPAVHHLLTITLYLVFLVKRQNGLCGVIGLVFQVDAVFIDTSKLLNEIDREEHEFANITWMNKRIGTVVTLVTRLILPTTLIIMSVTKHNIFTMDLVVVMFYFLSLVFFSMWNLLMFRNAVMGCIHYYFKMERRKLQSALECPLRTVQTTHAPVNDNQLVMEHNNWRRLPPLSNINIATTQKGIDRPNNLKIPKPPIRDVIGLQHMGEPSHSRARQVDRDCQAPIELGSSDYDPPSSVSDIDETSILQNSSNGKYLRIETVPLTSDSLSSNISMDGIETVTYNSQVICDSPSNIHHSYIHPCGNIERTEDNGLSSRNRERRQRRSTTESTQRRRPSVYLTESEAALTAQLAHVDNTTKTLPMEANNNNSIFEGIYIPTSRIQNIVQITDDMPSYPQYGERQSI